MLILSALLWMFIFGWIALIVVGCIKRSRAIILTALAVLVAVVAWGYVSDLREPFPFLEKAPNQELLPGTYVLDPISFNFLKSRGFDDFSAKIILNADKTFKVTRMPHIWIPLSNDNSGYDTYSGKWSVARLPDYNGYFYLTLPVDKGIYPDASGAVFLDMSPPKGKRDHYALIVPIFNGDFDYIYFVRQRD
jgi:hypothetical protein